MSKIKKAAAVVAASVLCMSMSLGVFASSPTDPEQLTPEEQEMIDDLNWHNEHYIYGASVEEKDGNKLTVSTFGQLEKEVIDTLQDEEKVKDILTDAGYIVEDDQDVVVIGVGDVKLYDLEKYETTEVPEGGIDLTLNLGWGDLEWTDEKLEGIEDGDTLYILHQKADGTWEVLEGKAVVKDQNGYTAYGVSAHFDSLSPVAVIKIMSNGEVVVLDKDNNVKETITTTTNTTTTTNATTATTSKAKGDSVKVVKTTTEKKSPKTGN